MTNGANKDGPPWDEATRDLELFPQPEPVRQVTVGKFAFEVPPAVRDAFDRAQAAIKNLRVPTPEGTQALAALVPPGALEPDPLATPLFDRDDSDDEPLVTAETAVESLLSFIGEDANRAGLQETPYRVVTAWGEWTCGYEINPAMLLKVFEDGAENVDEMVLITNIPVYSHCEHHMAAIFGEADVAYIPNGKIVGLSKIPRVVDAFARRLQVQERLTNQIATCLNDHLQPRGVAVRLRCRHMCMESRGINRPGTTTHTSALRGVFLTDPAARAEFFSMVAK